MKKLTALLMALLMAFTGVAFAEAVEPAAKAVTITDEIEIDIDAVMALLSGYGLNQEALEAIGKVLTVVDSVSDRLTIADNGMQYDVLMNDAVVYSLAGEANDAGIAIGSTLFPNYAITLSAETIQNTIEGLEKKVEESVDEQQVHELTDKLTAAGKAIGTHVGAYVGTVVGTITAGEMETGEFDLSAEGAFESVDITFNTRVPFEIDEKAIIDAQNKLIDDVLQDPDVVAAFDALKDLGVEINIDDVKKNIVPAEQTPEVAMTYYCNLDEYGMPVDDEAFYDFDITIPVEGEETMQAFLGILMHDAAHMDMRLTVPDLNSSLTVTVGMVANGDEQQGWSAVLNLLGNSYAIVNTADGDPAAGYFMVTNKFYALDMENPVVTAYTTGVKEGERTFEITGEGKTEIALEDLYSGKAKGKVSGLLMDVMLNGMGGMIGAATEAVPEFADLLAMFSSEEEAPAEAEATTKAA